MNIKVVTPPEKLPVSIEDLKEHLRIEITDDDRDVEQKINAVVSRLDPPNGILGRALITQTLRYSLEGNPARIIRLPYPPVQLISSVKYLNSSDVETTVSPSTYTLKNDHDPAFLVCKTTYSWPTDYSENDPHPFKINFICGYGDNPKDVPEMIRLAIMMEVGDYYMQRENISLGQPINRNEFTSRIFDNFIWRPY